MSDEVEFFLSKPVPKFTDLSQRHPLKQRAPTKCPEFTGDDAEIKDLLQQAIDGYQTRVNLLGNDIIARSNKLVFMVRRVAAALDDDGARR